VSSKVKDFSIIDKGLTVDGTVSCKGKLVVKGTVKGILEGETVIIAKEGAAYSDTKVGSLTIGGKFEGNLQVSNELILLSTGHCSGKVICKDLVVEAGGILNAEVSCTKFEEIKPKEKSLASN
jgi:cytoskeletal protein CcmA (bactofilin family)